MTDWQFIVKRLAQSGVEKDDPLLALAAGLTVAKAEIERLREALDMAIYHADNLCDYIDGKVVRDVEERAREALTREALTRAEEKR